MFLWYQHIYETLKMVFFPLISRKANSLLLFFLFPLSYVWCVKTFPNKWAITDLRPASRLPSVQTYLDFSLLACCHLKIGCKHYVSPALKSRIYSLLLQWKSNMYYTFLVCVIQNGMRMRRIINCGLPALHYFSTFFRKRHDFQRKLLNIRCAFWVFLHICLKHF